MIIKKNDMDTEVREKMRGGDGKVIITHLVKSDKMKNARLLAKIIIPVGAGIGDHRHDEETEYFIITKGEGIVVDDGIEKEVKSGDVVVTGGGGTHSIRNRGSVDLEMIAVIITY